MSRVGLRWGAAFALGSMLAACGKTTRDRAGAESSGGGALNGGAVSGGAASGGETGGLAAGGAASNGGHAAGGDAAPNGGTAGDAGGGGGGASAGSAGQGAASSPYLDARGDAPDPASDLLEAHLFVESDELVFRLRFAADPLSGAASRVELILPKAPSDSWFAALYVERRGDGFSVEWPYLSLSFDPCLVTTVDAATGWLEIRLPSWVASDKSLAPGFEVSVGFDADTLDAGAVPVESGPAPPIGGEPACAPWSEPDNPRNHVYRSTERYRDIAVQHDFGCGLTLEGEVICWGTASALGELGPAPPGPFADIAVGPSDRSA